jgi:hypothetical protein
MFTIIVLVMNIATNTTRLVLAEMLLKETKKDVSFYSQRVKVEPSETNLSSLADAEAMVRFYEGEIAIYS